MFRKLSIKLKMIRLILTANSVHFTFQRYSGKDFKSIAFGHSSLKDLVLFAKELKTDHDGLLTMINELAANAGELHALQDLKDAAEAIPDGRN
jgi:hypothetical protein